MDGWRRTPPKNGRGRHRRSVGEFTAIVERKDGEGWDWYITNASKIIRWGECDTLDGAKARAGRTMATLSAEAER